MTLYERWTSNKPNPCYIRRFGCMANAAVPAEKRQGRSLMTEMESLLLLVTKKVQRVADFLAAN